MATASNLILKPQTGTGGGTLYAAWTWDTSKHQHTKEYSVQFEYDSGDGRWFSGSEETVTVKNATYSPPDNAIKAKFRVKPISSTYTTSVKSGSSTKSVTKNYWSANWSSWKYYDIRSQNPDIPSVPTIVVADNNAKFYANCSVSISDSSVNAARTIEFYIYDYDIKAGTSTHHLITGTRVNANGLASISYVMTAGHKYKTRCRAKDSQGDYSAYSNYTDDYTYARPLVPSNGIHTCKTISSNQINIDWDREGSDYADTYCIEYTTNKGYFDVSADNVKSVTEDVSTGRSYYIFTGLESGYTYYFRLRVQGGHNNGYSDWTPIVSSVVGEKPAAPTTWALSTVAELDDELVLYWTHNAQDSSSLTYSQVELSINDVSTDEATSGIIVIKNSDNEDLVDKTNSIIISTADGTVLNGKTGEAIEDFDSIATTTYQTLHTKSNLQDLEGIISSLDSNKLSTSTDWEDLKSQIAANSIISTLSQMSDEEALNIYNDISTNLSLLDESYSSSSGTISYDETARSNLQSAIASAETFAISWTIDTISISDLLQRLSSGGTLTWRVRTCGVIFSGYTTPDKADPSLDYGEWSILRTITVYAPPTLEISNTGIVEAYDDNLRILLIQSLQEMKDYALAWTTTDENGYYQVFQNEEYLEDIDNIITLLEKSTFDISYNIDYVISRIQENAIFSLLSSNESYFKELEETDVLCHTKVIQCYDNLNSDIITRSHIIEKYPFYITMKCGPDSQHAIRYFLSIMANESYETNASDGSVKMINKGNVIYSEYIDGPNNEVTFTIDATKIHLENGVEYQINGIVSMSSGLTAEDTRNITISFDNSSDEYEITADIAIDDDTLISLITPQVFKYTVGTITYDTQKKDNLLNAVQAIYDYVNNLSSDDETISNDVLSIFKDNTNLQILLSIIEDLQDDNLATVDDIQTIESQLYNSEIITALPTCEKGLTLYDTIFQKYTEFENSIEGAYTKSNVSNVYISVYRKNTDGTLTPIATNIYSEYYTTVTDPHPSLNYVSYRIIAVFEDTGQMLYYDINDVEVGFKIIAINWDETWQEFNISESANESDVQPWQGSLLKLLYNIDISEEHAPDVELVEYIGREHPVDYYGTQLGENGTWSFAIDAEDTETLYALRRLAIYMGSVYIRGPSGIGYWANITVSISEKHCEMTIPVTLTVTRVEGDA